jgi:hypothetical protein
VDVTLIRRMLSLTPAARMLVLRSHAHSIERMRESTGQE